jgi:hypothetical protein
MGFPNSPHEKQPKFGPKRAKLGKIGDVESLPLPPAGDILDLSDSRFQGDDQ